MSFQLRRSTLMVALLFLLAPAQLASAEHLETFELQATRSPSFQEMLIDETGTPWVLAGGLVQYFDGKQFVALDSEVVRSGSYTSGLYGGPDRGVFLTQTSKNPQEGIVYRLRDGNCEEITTFFYEVGHEKPSVYVSKNGRIFNWGTTFLAVFDGQHWKRIEGEFHRKAGYYRPEICDLGDEVYLYSAMDNRVYHCDADSILSAKDGPEEVGKAIAAHNQRSQYPVPPMTCSWNGDRVIITLDRSPRPFAFNVRTNELIELSLVPEEGQPRSYADFMECRDGSVLMLARISGIHQFALCRLDVDGKVRELPGSRIIPWGNARLRMFPKSILAASDGSIVVGLPEFGIAIYHDGKLTTYDANYGLFTPVNVVVEGPTGDVWFPHDRRGHQVARMKLGQPLEPIQEIAEDWKEFKLVSRSRLWQLTDDTLAMFEVEHNNQMTRRTGDQVTYQPVPFKPEETQGSIVDDRGHLILESFRSAAFDVGPDGVEEYESIQDALVAAVAAGAKQFDPSPEFSGVILTENGELWYGKHNDRRVFWREGDKWKEARFQDDVYHLFETDEGVLIRTQGGSLYRPVDGRMVKDPETLRSGPPLMLGPKEFQPLDEQLIEAHPGRYYPVRQVEGEMRVFYDLAAYHRSFQSAVIAKLPMNSFPLPNYYGRVIKSRHEGAWLLMSHGGSQPYRIFHDRMVQLDLNGTPLAAQNVREILEAANGDVWFTTYYGDHPRALRLSASQLKIEAPPIDQRVGREMQLAIEVKPTRLKDKIELFTTVNGVRQEVTPTDDDKILFRFPHAGTYQCSVGAIWLGAIQPKLLEFEVEAAFEMPETNWTSTEQPYTIQTTKWRPPVQVIPTQASSQTTLEWRVAGESWQKIQPTQPIDFSVLSPGEYDMELRGVEDRFWYDPTPVQVKVKYSPDYFAIVHELAMRLGSPHAEERRQAAQQLEALGPAALPELRREIKASEGDQQIVPTLRNVLERIERNSKPQNDAN